MKLRNRLYPYPVLFHANDDYDDQLFDSSMTIRTTKKKIFFAVDVMLTDDKLQDFINNEQACFVIHLECSSTCYRESIEFKSLKHTFEIDSNRVNDIVEVCLFIMAKQNIENYSNNNFNEIYDGMSFNIEKYNILAIGSERQLQVDKDYDSLKNINSIITVIPDDVEKTVSYEYYGDVIKVLVPRLEFNKYKLISDKPIYYPIIHSTLVIPVLTEIFAKLKDEDSISEFENLRWYRSIIKTIEKKNINLDFTNIDETEMFRKIQLLIGNPITQTFNSLMTLSIGGDDDL